MPLLEFGWDWGLESHPLLTPHALNGLCVCVRAFVYVVGWLVGKFHSVNRAVIGFTKLITSLSEFLKATKCDAGARETRSPLIAHDENHWDKSTGPHKNPARPIWTYRYWKKATRERETEREQSCKHHPKILKHICFTELL